MRAIQWENKVGWNVGRAEVRDLVTRLRAFVPIRPAREFSTRVNRFITIDRYRMCDVPLGTDPVQAVTTARVHGLIVRTDTPRTHPVPYVEG